MDQPLPNTQWYNVNPAPAPVFHRSRIWVGVGVVVGVLLLSGVITLGQYLWSGSQKTAQIVSTQNQASNDCATAQDPEKCRQALAANLAGKNGDTAFCAGLADAQLDECLAAAALTAKSKKPCEKITNTVTRSECEDAVQGTIISGNYVFADCGGFIDQTRRSECESAWKINAALRGECAAPVDETLCVAGKAIKIAIDRRDPGLCQGLTQDYLDYCRQLVGPTDLDLDGLDAAEEKIRGTNDALTDTDSDGLSDFDEALTLGTDPTKADTDGDSFPDGVEIQGGYDPLH